MASNIADFEFVSVRRYSTIIPAVWLWNPRCLILNFFPFQLSPSYKVTLSEKKIVFLRGVASLENNNLLVYYSMYLKFELIRGMVGGAL